MLSDQDKAAITTHMNEDHADACLLYVHCYAGKTEAVRARLTGVCSNGMDLEFDTAGAESGSCRIPFPEPAADRTHVRQLLVEMVKQARVRMGS